MNDDLDDHQNDQRRIRQLAAMPTLLPWEAFLDRLWDGKLAGAA